LNLKNHGFGQKKDVLREADKYKSKQILEYSSAAYSKKQKKKQMVKRICKHMMK
jgi:hypothetical protein